MKIKYKTIIVIVIVAIICCSIYVPIIPINVNGVTLKIIDSESGISLDNVTVYSIVILAGISTEYGIPWPNPTTFTDAYYGVNYSDNNGNVEIPGRIIMGKLFDKKYRIRVAINLDINQEYIDNKYSNPAKQFYDNIYIRSKGIKFINIIKEYKGCIINITRNKEDTTGTVYDEYYYLYDICGIGKDYNEYSIKLEKW